MEEAAAPLAWGCETGRDAAPPIGFVDNGFHSVDDLTPNVTATGATYAQYGSQSTYHGTQVASVAGAQGANHLRMTGMAWDADLRLYQAALISPPTTDGIRILAQGGARVVNISLAVPWTSKPKNKWKDSLQVLGVASQLRMTLQNLANQGFPILVVQGAGNGIAGNGIDAFWQAFGASVDHDSLRRGGPRFRESVLVVTASERQQAGVRSLAAFADTGGSVDLAAPGVDVGTLDRFDNVVVASGTSLSAPFVTGLGALVLAFDTTLTTADVRQFILEGAQRGGGVAIDRNGGARTYPIINAYEALKRAAERPGARLCGNRVWAADNMLVAERDPVAHTTETLVNLGEAGPGVDVYHGGRRIEVTTALGDRDRAFALQQGQWVETTDTATTPPGGTFFSMLARSHDWDSTASERTLATSGPAAFEINVYEFATTTQTTIDTLVFSTSERSGSECIVQNVRGECVLSFPTSGTTELLSAGVAFPSVGGRLLVAVSHDGTQTTAIGGWQGCPNADTTFTSCRSVSQEEQIDRAELWAVDLRSRQATHLWTFPNGGVYWFGVSEDGSQVVSGEGARTIAWTFLGTGPITWTDPGTIRGCAVRYRSIADGTEVAPAVFTADACAAGALGHGTVAPTPRRSSSP